MSEPKDGYCWCWMCGYTAKVKAADRATVANDAPCPDCNALYGSLLCEGDEMDPDMILDDPMPVWPNSVDGSSE